MVGSVRRIARAWSRWSAGSLVALASVWWIAFVLERFPFTRRWGEDLTLNLLQIGKQVVLGIAGALPGLVFVIVIFLLARALIGLVRVFFDGVEPQAHPVGLARRRYGRADTAHFGFVVWVFMPAMAYPYLPGRIRKRSRAFPCSSA